MTRGNPSIYQDSYEFVRKVLCKVLSDGVRIGLGPDGGIGSVQCRVSGALYALLLTHKVDERGRCRFCRHPGMFGWRLRRCDVAREAGFWLRQPDWLLSSRGTPGLAVGPPLPIGCAHCAREYECPPDPEDTDIVARGVPDSSGPPRQTPAVPPPPPAGPPRAGQPDPHHGGAEDDPARPGLAWAPPRHGGPTASGGREWP
ncbi:MAG: hypothetical protein ACRDQ4_25620 [Pseudonocardiaceae bacterium]